MDFNIEVIDDLPSEHLKQRPVEVNLLKKYVNFCDCFGRLKIQRGLSSRWVTDS